LLLVIWFSQAASYYCNMNNKRAKEKGEAILRLKREGQARSRALVKDGIRTQESMFLIPPAVAKVSKVKYKI